MGLLFDRIFTLLTTPPGNLIYHIVLVFSIVWTLLGAIRLLQSGQIPQARRLVIGLGILLGLQVLLFTASAFAWGGVLDSQIVLPPLDRLVTLLGLVWITWLWAFPDRSWTGDFAATLFSLLGLTLFGLTLAFRAYVPSPGFNNSFFDVVWQAFSLAVILLGLLILVIRKTNDWGNGLAMLLLAFSGHLLSLIWYVEGNFPGFVRLTQMALFPILLTLLPRSPLLVSEQETAGGFNRTSEKSIQERRDYNIDPRSLHSLLSLAGEVKAEDICRDLTRGISQIIPADLCLLVTIAKDKSMSIAGGYDLIHEKSLDGSPFIKDAVPQLANAIQRGRPLRLSVKNNSSELKNLVEMVGLSDPGHLLGIPITSRESGPIGAILILSPYSNRLWNAKDQSYLGNISNLFIPILERGQQTLLLETEREQAQQETLSAQEKAADLKTKYEQASNELTQAQEHVSQVQIQTENMGALLVMQEEAEKTIESLTKQIEHMRQTGEIASLPEESKKVEEELRQTLAELASLQNILADANGKIMELEQRSATSLTTEQVEVIASISQELRQPMSSIVGYTDLLLGESVGNLGPLQRKFVERVKASTERVGGLVDDLIHITNLETGKLVFNAELIDLNHIIDNAMSYTSTQIREKNLTLRLDIAEDETPIKTDRDALQQIFIHLLQNATAANESEGTITLRVQLQNESDQHFISIQVTDTGGGISPEDINRVFSRRYRAEHSLIKGLGDTGVGLSIAKALVESQGGRIWVETERDSGSTFSVLLPVLLDVEVVD